MDIRGKRITEDADGFLSLTDLWKLGGSPASKLPTFWRRLPTTKELLAALNVDLRFSQVIENTPYKSAVYIRKGRNSQTFAHVILALAYTEYLSPELGIEVRDIALRVYAGDVTVLDEYAKAKRAQLEDDHDRVMVREEVRRNNYELNMILKFIGATSSMHWSKFHNDGYIGLYDGLTENQIHALKKLKRGQAILDHMGHHELVANMFRTSTAQQYLIAHNIDSVLRACEIHRKFGEKVRAFLAENDLPMPETHPVYPSVKESYKRLKQSEKMRSK